MSRALWRRMILLIFVGVLFCGFAFVPTALHVIDILNERAKVYQAEVLRCVSKLEK